MTRLVSREETGEAGIEAEASSEAAVTKAAPGAAVTSVMAPAPPTPRVQCHQESMCYDLLKWWRLRALLVKNFIRMWRNLGFLVFQFLIPTVQVSHLVRKPYTNFCERCNNLSFHPIDLLHLALDVKEARALCK